MLTSIKNPKVAGAVRLKKRAFREEDRRFLVEGAQCVGEALAGSAGLLSLFTADDMSPLAVLARQSSVEVHHVSQDVAAKLTSTVTPQGIVGVAPFVDVGIEALPNAGCVVVLHEVRDPGNAGTVLRSADATGAAGVVFTSSSVDAYNPKTVRASAGSLFHLPVVRGVEAPAAIRDLRDRGFTVMAMAADGDDDLYGTDLSGPIAFVFGNEAHGLSGEVVASADRTVRVPHAGAAESLNLAAAATVCLFEWARRRRGANETLETLIAAVAHDIRSPLTAMKGFGYALGKRWAQMSDEQRALMLSGIMHDADRMDTIVRQLVDAARVLGGTLDLFPERVDFGELVAGVAEMLRRDPEHPEVRFLGNSPNVVLDPARLRNAVLSFVEALVWWGATGPIDLGAADAGGTLTVRASRAATDITAEFAETLFTARKPGTGAGSKIGLFVTRAVAQRQGGRAWAEVTSDRLTFVLEIPA